MFMMQGGADMAHINGRTLLKDVAFGLVSVFFMMLCFVSISFEGTVLNESYLLKQNGQTKYVQQYKRIYDEVLVYCAQSVDLSSGQAREMALTDNQVRDLLKDTTKRFCREDENLVDIDLFVRMSESNLEDAIRSRRIVVTQHQLYSFHTDYRANAERYFRLKLGNSGVYSAQRMFISARRWMRVTPVISMTAVLVMLILYCYLNGRNARKTMRVYGELLFITSLCTILVALVSSLANSSSVSGSVSEFHSLFVSYMSLAQNLTWGIGLCSFCLGAFMMFFGSDEFQMLLEAARYNSKY